MMKRKPLLIAVVGPTAIGKTALAIQLAKHFKKEIISADSRQFYKEMSIGTAVPSQEELAEATHYFIQHKSIHDSYSVGDFERDTLGLLDTLFLEHKVVIMVGGSGMYVDAVVNGMDTFPEVDPKIREFLNKQLADHGIEGLQKQLSELDPVHFQKVDIHNPQRVIRALEVCLASGQPYSSFLNKHTTTRAFDTLYMGLEAPREVVYDRINTRVDVMIQSGLVEEVKSLLPYRNTNALQTVGYRELFAYFNEQSSLEEAIEEIKKNTRRFAKRQFTWFKRNPQIQWFSYPVQLDEVTSYLKERMS